MSRSWSNAEKRRLVEGLCRPGAMSQPYDSHPFGRVLDSRGLHEYFLAGEFESGERFQRAKRAMDTYLCRMLQRDFTPLVDQVPAYIKATHDGILNTGDQLIRWLYYTYNFYDSDEDSDSDEEEEATDGEADEEADEEEDSEEDEEDEEMEDSEDEQEQPAEEPGTREFRLEEPSEEYSRRVNEYNSWIRHREGLPDA
ncbi:hypothetical protein PG993_011410 [Apiospora rasikravindrae]|uniref:Uncharacterized protein n=1 Tax=Apiospora rasikravindrae TaxID=990691 RepID=A0ABR1SFY5_9PEZI